jgi:hypothetical protein
MASTYASHVTFVSETFTGNLSNVLTPNTGKRLVISGWSLTLSGNAAACQISLLLGSNVHVAAKFPIAGTTAGAPLLNWTVTNVAIWGDLAESLSINGGATSGVLDGVIFVSQV